MQDYGARFYDPQVPHWLTIDQKAERFDSWSPYVYCLNNPVRHVDPDGKDVFDTNGNLIRTDKTNIIKIQTDNGIVNLSAFPMNNMDNRLAVANIAKYYGAQVGINSPGYIGVKNSRTDNSSKNPAFTEGNDIYLNAKGGGLNKDLDNVNNMKSTLYHEKLHKDKGQGFKGKEATNLEHAQVYLDQMKDKSFANTTDEFKLGMIGSVSNYIKDAASDMMATTGNLTPVTDLVNALNDLSKVTGCNVSLQVVSGSSDPSAYEFKVNVYKAKEEKK